MAGEVSGLPRCESCVDDIAPIQSARINDATLLRASAKVATRSARRLQERFLELCRERDTRGPCFRHLCAIT